MCLQVIKNCPVKTFAVSFVMFVISLSIPTDALSQTDCNKECQQNLAQTRNATAKYHRVEAALADGYIPTPECTSSPDGGMGTHYINPSLMDMNVSATQPEVLLYETMKNGKQRLIGVEYFVPVIVNGAGPWFGSEPPPADQFNSAPSLFGQTFNGPMEGHEPGMPWHYDLHVWIWKNNPTDMFAPFNPNVQCAQQL